MEFRQLIAVVVLREFLGAGLHPNALAVVEGAVVCLLETPSPGLLTMMARLEALVVVDEVILLTSMVGFELECRQKLTVEILITLRVNQEAHSGEQFNMF